MIRYAVFDVDGTLLDSSPMWADLGSRYIRSTGGSPAAGLDETLRNLSLEEAACFLKKEYSLPYSADEIVRQITRMTEEFYLAEVRPRDGARELLAALRAKNVHMAIATAGDKKLAAAALERLGLWEYFSAAASCSEYGPKTSPEVYLAAAEMIFALPCETLVFEDSLHAVRAAKSAGFVTAAVRDISEPKQEALKSAADFYEESLTGYAAKTGEILK